MWLFLLRRLIISALNAAFREVLFDKNEDTPKVIQNGLSVDACSELCTALRLLPIAVARTNLPLFPKLIAFDASQVAGAVTYCEPNKVLLHKILAFCASNRP